MRAWILVALLTGPHVPTPTREAWIVVEPAQRESQVLLSEWNRVWKLSPLQLECSVRFKVQVVDRSHTVGITDVPCVVVGERQYPVRGGASGESLRNVHRILREWLVEPPPQKPLLSPPDLPNEEP